MEESQKPTPSDPDFDSQETDVEWRENRVSAANFVALQLRDRDWNAKADYGTAILGIVAIALCSPVAYILYRHGFWGALWVFAIPLTAWFVSIASELFFKHKLEADQEEAASALDRLAATIKDDSEMPDD